jgi:metal-dependent amidase/aminoacylase/carboxypeptidase family protein
MDLRANLALCRAYVEEMRCLGEEVLLEQPQPYNASTDMGNVSHLVPSFHGAFAIPAPSDCSGHNPKFAAAAGTDDAHQAAIRCAKSMAMLAVRVLIDEGLAENARSDFNAIDENS